MELRRLTAVSGIGKLTVDKPLAEWYDKEESRREPTYGREIEMTIFTFENVDTTSWNDCGSTRFNIVAETEKEAWKKALEIEDRENIVGIVGRRVVGI